MIQKNTSAPAEIRGKIQSFVESLLDDNADVLRERFAELPAKDMFNVLAKLLPYVAPRQTAVRGGNTEQEKPKEAKPEEAAEEIETTEDKEAPVETTPKETVETTSEEKEIAEAVDEAEDTNDGPTNNIIDSVNAEEEQSDPPTSPPVKTKRPNKGSGKSSKNKKARKRR